MHRRAPKTKFFAETNAYSTRRPRKRTSKQASSTAHEPNTEETKVETVFHEERKVLEIKGKESGNPTPPPPWEKTPCFYKWGSPTEVKKPKTLFPFVQVVFCHPVR
jgi:hypothetical protein